MVGIENVETTGQATARVERLAVGCVRPEPLYVEVSSLLTRELTGIGRFAARMVEALAQWTSLRLVSTIQGEHAKQMRLLPYLPAGREMVVTAPDLPPAPDADLVEWVRRLFQRPTQPHDPDLARHCAGLYTLLRPPRRHFGREVSILYDFTPVLLPWAHVDDTCKHFGKFFAETSGVCDKAVAISRATRDDARWLCAVPEADIAVGYPGPSLCVRAHAHLGRVARSANVALVVSTMEPRKNGPFLLHWFLHTAVLPPDMELWWVGPQGWLCDMMLPDRPRARNVRFLGMVSDTRLCELYRQATFTIYPSLYEGFGFPVLDALRHGTPVVSSFNSSLEEFAGPGVFYFDACDPASLDAACRDLLASRPFALDPHALDERFSWDALARTVQALCA